MIGVPSAEGARSALLRAVADCDPGSNWLLSGTGADTSEAAVLGALHGEKALIVLDDLEGD